MQVHCPGRRIHQVQLHYHVHGMAVNCGPSHSHSLFDNHGHGHALFVITIVTVIAIRPPRITFVVIVRAAVRIHSYAVDGRVHAYDRCRWYRSGYGSRRGIGDVGMSCDEIRWQRGGRNPACNGRGGGRQLTWEGWGWEVR